MLRKFRGAARAEKLWAVHGPEGRLRSMVVELAASRGQIYKARGVHALELASLATLEQAKEHVMFAVREEACDVSAEQRSTRLDHDGNSGTYFIHHLILISFCIFERAEGVGMMWLLRAAA